MCYLLEIVCHDVVHSIHTLHSAVEAADQVLIILIFSGLEQAPSAASLDRLMMVSQAMPVTGRRIENSLAITHSAFDIGLESVRDRQQSGVHALAHKA